MANRLRGRCVPGLLCVVLLVGGASPAVARPLARDRGASPARPSRATASPTADSTGASLVRMQAPPFTLRIGLRVQLRLTHQDPEVGDATTTVQVRRGRLTFSGAAYEHFDYVLQLEAAGPSVSLIDANVRWSPSPLAALWFGQGKAPFGRQQLTSSGALQFVDRTIVDDRFSAKRQQGVAVLGRLAGEVVEYNAGVYNGEGTNRPVNPDNRFMAVGRVVLSPLGAYAPVESAHDYPDAPRLAIGVSGLRHGVGRGAEAAVVTRVNSEAAFKLRGFSATAEGYREWDRPSAGEGLRADGWYLQAGYLLPGRNHEIAGRYAEIRPDAPLEPELAETGLAYSYYFRAHNAKLQLDLRSIHDRGDGGDRREARVQFQLAL